MYQFKEVELKNKHQNKKVLAIEFKDQDMDIVAEFLMTDASLLDYGVLTQVDQVLAGNSKRKVSNGNRYGLVIERNTTKIEDLFEDLFDDFNTYEPYEMSTVKLRELIVMWRDKKDEFDRGNK